MRQPDYLKDYLLLLPVKLIGINHFSVHFENFEFQLDFHSHLK